MNSKLILPNSNRQIIKPLLNCIEIAKRSDGNLNREIYRLLKRLTLTSSKLISINGSRILSTNTYSIPHQNTKSNFISNSSRTREKKRRSKETTKNRTLRHFNCPLLLGENDHRNQQENYIFGYLTSRRTDDDTPRRIKGMLYASRQASRSVYCFHPRLRSKTARLNGECMDERVIPTTTDTTLVSEEWRDMARC